VAIGYKKKGDTGPLYNPERDYAYITPTLMRIAIEHMERPAPEEYGDWEEFWVADNGTNSDAVNAAAVALAKAQRDFVNGAEPVASLADALNRHEWSTVPYAARMLLLASIGEVFLAAWFTAVREVSIVGEESPAQLEMARFTNAVRFFVAGTDAAELFADPPQDTLLMQNAVLQTRVNELGLVLKDMQQQLIILRAALAASPKPTRWTRLCSWFRTKKGI
jgi:hypothetical protein